MHLLQQEFGRDKEYREKTSQYISAVQKDVLSWRQEDGAWPAGAWVVTSASEGNEVRGVFRTVQLLISEGREKRPARPFKGLARTLSCDPR
jgi:hypothetical protein